MRWIDKKFNIVMLSATIVLVVMIHGCSISKCKHDYKTVKESTSVVKHDGYWEKGVKKFLESPRTSYHLRCRQCGEMKTRRLH